MTDGITYLAHFFFWLRHLACRILVPQPGIESESRQWNCWVLTLNCQETPWNHLLWWPPHRWTCIPRTPRYLSRYCSPPRWPPWWAWQLSFPWGWRCSGSQCPAGRTRHTWVKGAIWFSQRLGEAFHGVCLFSFRQDMAAVTLGTWAKGL